MRSTSSACIAVSAHSANAISSIHSMLFVDSASPATLSTSASLVTLVTRGNLLLTYLLMAVLMRLFRLLHSNLVFSDVDMLLQHLRYRYLYSSTDV